ncbi:hypothetical protein JAAARDRAFT_38644 [Jaapia argillacea MUCL 33604]|uniref:Uncharacterized protein n=1 Tax=Jaapia argillacea MUCL 33604 TaxID=933084 RepID=A0A067PJN6_9AGAM|nr:hypothetical protein JAAARDRAFT_38644 [Jaapia argillacea MUCL 33604]
MKAGGGVGLWFSPNVARSCETDTQSNWRRGKEMRMVEGLRYVTIGEDRVPPMRTSRLWHYIAITGLPLCCPVCAHRVAGKID